MMYILMYILFSTLKTKGFLCVTYYVFAAVVCVGFMDVPGTMEYKGSSLNFYM